MGVLTVIENFVFLFLSLIFFPLDHVDCLQPAFTSYGFLDKAQKVAKTNTQYFEFLFQVLYYLVTAKHIFSKSRLNWRQTVYE